MAQDLFDKMGGETGGSILDLLKQTQQAGQAGVSAGMARQDAQTSKFLEMSQNVFKMRYDTEQPFIADKEGNERELTQRELLGSMMGVPPEGLTWKQRTDSAGIEQPKMVRVTEEMKRIAQEVSGTNITAGEYYPSGTITQFMTRIPSTPEGKLEQLRKKEVIKAEEKGKAKARDMQVSFEKVKELMTRGMAQFKGKIEEQKGGGIVRGAIGVASAKLKRKGFARVSSFPGQITEMALPLNKILSGQNRVVKSLYDRIVKSLPSEYDTVEFAANKISQSVRNSYGLVKAMSSQGITPEYLNQFSDEELNDPNHIINTTIQGLAPEKLSDEENKYIDNIVQQIIDVPAAKKVTVSKTRKPKIGRFDILEGGN